MSYLEMPFYCIECGNDFSTSMELAEHECEKNTG